VNLTSNAEEGLRCPHCGKNAMSTGAKLCLGPARTQRCRSCGTRVSVPWESFLVFWREIVGILLCIFLPKIAAAPWRGRAALQRLGFDSESVTMTCLLLGAGLLVWVLVRMFYVWPRIPLQDRDHSSTTES
jgi:hypothetical protein